MGLALLPAARGVDARQPGARRRHPPGTRPRAAQGAPGRSRSPSTSACSASSSTTTSSSRRCRTGWRTSASTSRGAVLEVTLPIGISFFTFQALSYVDRHLPRRLPARSRWASSPSTCPSSRTSSPARSCARASSSRSSRRPRDPRRVDVGLAAFLIVGGLFKKVVIANFLADAIVDDVFGAPEPALVARGAGRGLRLRGADLLRLLAATPTSRSASRCCSASASRRTSTRPYSAESLQDFWRRWHMTLSRWLRDYLYIPLGGSRGLAPADVPQPDADHAARRPLARRGVDVRGLGRHPRRRAGRGALAGRAARARAGCPSRRRPGCAATPGGW